MGERGCAGEQPSPVVMGEMSPNEELTDAKKVGPEDRKTRRQEGPRQPSYHGVSSSGDASQAITEFLLGVLFLTAEEISKYKRTKLK